MTNATVVLVRHRVVTPRRSGGSALFRRPPGSRGLPGGGPPGSGGRRRCRGPRGHQVADPVQDAFHPEGELPVRRVELLEHPRGDELGEGRETLRIGQLGQQAAVGRHPLVRGGPGGADRGLDVRVRAGLVAHVPADQQDHRRLLRFGEPGIPQAAEGLLEPGDLVGADGQPADRYPQDPGVGVHDRAHRPGQGRQPLPPSLVRRRGHQELPVHGVHHQRDQLVLGRHVPVERHRGGPQLGRHPAHRHRGQAFGLGDLDASVDDPRQAQARFGPPVRPLAQPPGRLDARRQIHRSRFHVLVVTPAALARAFTRLTPS